MKKSLFVAILVSITLTCLTQGFTKEPLIEKDRYGGIKSVEFIQGIENSKIPSSPQFFSKNF